MPDTLLSVDGLCVALPPGADRPWAVKDVSFDLRRGEILCIVGESGSGKSVSANAIMGLLPHTLVARQGAIRFNGKDLLTQPERSLQALRGREIAMIFQEPMSALNPLMTVGEQIHEVMAVHQAYPGAARAARVLELLALVGLPDPSALQRAYPFRLSGGQRQRVMIAMAMALEPSVLIADEPTTALDVSTQAQILALIKRLQASTGMGVMFITHDFGVVADIADRVVVMEQGVVVEQGDADQVLNRPGHPYTRRLINAVPQGRSSSLAGRAAGQPVLQVTGLQKTYVTSGGWTMPRRIVRAVDDVSFDVMPGETLGVVGESGSGKSTIGKCLLKLMDVDAGKILFRGRDIAPLPPAAFRPHRRHLQMIFQDPFASLNPRHTVGRIVMEGPLAHGMTPDHAEQRARELLRQVELSDAAFHRYPHEFSGGQRQRVGIARALALEPQILVADESVSALDVSVQAQVLALLQDIQRRTHVAMIFITHDLRVAAQICHRIAVMHRGKIVEYGDPASVLERPTHAYTQSLIASIPGKRWSPPRLPGRGELEGGAVEGDAAEPCAKV